MNKNYTIEKSFVNIDTPVVACLQQGSERTKPDWQLVNK